MKTSKDPIREALHKAPKASKATLTRLRKELRYMSPENVIEDFGSDRDRKVIAAVLEWFGLNSTVAWRIKDGTYDCVWNRDRNKPRDLNASDAIVMTEKAWRSGRDILVKK